MLEDRKSYSVGGGDENKSKNRSELIIPYDRNRVILTPVPGREHSTYINASFIEGYDNSESFVITQDPLETTIADFWRMISEQCISTIVMLSDVSITLLFYVGTISKIIVTLKSLIPLVAYVQYMVRNLLVI